jgi:hypothetical protein
MLMFCHLLGINQLLLLVERGLVFCEVGSEVLDVI